MTVRQTVRISAIVPPIFLAALRLAAQQLPVSPPELVRRTVANEIRSTSPDTHFMFQSRKQTPHGVQTKLFVETQQATAAILIAINDHPLNQNQRRAEELRLHALANNPEELKKKQRQEREDVQRVTQIVRALPSALLYAYDGWETGQAEIGKTGERLIRLKFQPNPKYTPPSRVEQILTGMQGDLLIDPNRNRIASINATLYKEVGFGWGILGHLDRGGRFQVEQAEVSDSVWEVTHMWLSFTGKILLFKSLVIQSNETFHGFHPVPKDLTFAQGVELLEQETSKTVTEAPPHPGGES